MADEPRIVISSEPTISSEEIARRTFATAFRGFDAPEVRSFLKRVAEAYAGLQEDVANLRRRVDELQRREREPVDLDEDTLTAALGAETARVLKSAREAAADIQAKAEQKVARLVKEAEEEAARLRAEADGVLGRRVEEAEDVAAGIRRAAEADAEAARTKAKTAADAEIEAAKAQGRELLTQAQALREKVLGDLTRRRKLALAQVEQLRAGRERLLDAYRVVRRTLDEVTVELSAAEAEARLAAESAGRKVAAEADVTIEDLEADLAAGRATSLGDTAEGVAIEGDVETVTAEPPDEAAEPAPGPAPEPAPEATDVADVDAADAPAARSAPVVQLEERRSSTLRIIRRSKDGGAAEAAVELPVVEPGEADEAVRVIREDVEVVPEPTPEAAPEPEAPAPPDDVVAAVPDLVQQATSTGRNGVDALFARIRADRASAVAEARAVLDDEPPEVATAAAADEPAAETRGEIEAEVTNADESMLQRRDALLHRVDATLVRKLKRALQDDQNETLDRLRTSRGATNASDALSGETEHAARFRDVAVRVLEDAARAGVEFAGHGDRAVGVGDQADELALEVVVSLRDRLTRNLEDGAAAGDDIGGIIDRVGTTYREWKLQRIEPLARHAVATVFARNAYAATPDGARLRWVVDDDGGPCPDCDDDALAGPTEKGTAFPTGQLHPPAHPGCRCVLVADGDPG
jgi:DivIVA domain-containing protein